jgi:alkylation response protein AidB-like acyl-CoA dehydrogenase
MKGEPIGTPRRRYSEPNEEAVVTMTTFDAVSTVEGLVPSIRSACKDIDAARRLPATVVGSLQEAGVFQLLAPRELGGAEADPLTFLDVVEAASFADGSAGWCTMIGGCYATFGGMLPEPAAREIYGDPSTISAGAFRPDGRAEEVEGGYRVTGRWTLGSGSSHATWYVAGCMVTRDGQPVLAANGAPLFREVFFPASVVEVIDTWDSTGLRGTASNDYAVTDLFVPASHTMWFQEPPRCGGALYRMPPIAMFATFIGAVPLGIARHAIDELRALAVEKTPVLSASVLADKALAQADLGRAHALVASARAYLRERLADLWDRINSGHAPTLDDRGELWLAATHAAQSAVTAVDLVYAAAGASSVYATSPLDRCLRDARTAAQHITTQKANYELAGRALLGRLELPNIWAMDYRGEA